VKVNIYFKNKRLALHLLGAAALVGYDGSDWDGIGGGRAHPLPIPVLFVENGELQTLGFGTNHNYFTRKLFKSGLSAFLGFFSNTQREGHGSFQLTVLPHSAFEMYARALVRKNEFDRHRVERAVFGIGGVPTVRVKLELITIFQYANFSDEDISHNIFA
jgi:hypothetical protein